MIYYIVRLRVPIIRHAITGWPAPTKQYDIPMIKCPGSGRRVFIKQCVVLVLACKHLGIFKCYTVFTQNSKNAAPEHLKRMQRAALIDMLEPRTMSDQYAMNAQ